MASNKPTRAAFAAQGSVVLENLVTITMRGLASWLVIRDVSRAFVQEEGASYATLIEEAYGNGAGYPALAVAEAVKFGYLVEEVPDLGAFEQGFRVDSGDVDGLQVLVDETADRYWLLQVEVADGNFINFSLPQGVDEIDGNLIVVSAEQLDNGAFITPDGDEVSVPLFVPSDESDQVKHATLCPR